MSEVMRLLMDAQEQVRRLAVHVDRANALLGKTTETEDALRAEMNEANAAEVAKLRTEVERLTRERRPDLWRSYLREHAEAGHDLPLDDPAWLLEQIANWIEAEAQL